MSTQNQTDVTAIANRVVELSKQGKYAEIQNELFSNDAVSVEPAFTQQPPTQGLDAIREKGKQWADSVAQVNGGYVTGPVVAGNHFTIGLGVDVTKKDGERMNMEEIILYKVENGKIVSEQFFY